MSRGWCQQLEPLTPGVAGLFLKMELSKVPTSSRQQYYPVILVDPPSPISHLTTPSPIHRSWSWHGKCPLPTGLSQKWGSSQAYLLTLLDVVVLPDTGARDEHDFELLLMPAIDEGGEVLSQFMRENRSGLPGGLKGAWVRLGEVVRLFLHHCPCQCLMFVPFYSHPRVPMNIQEWLCLSETGYVPTPFWICVLIYLCVRTSLCVHPPHPLTR